MEKLHNELDYNTNILISNFKNKVELNEEVISRISAIKRIYNMIVDPEKNGYIIISDFNILRIFDLPNPEISLVSPFWNFSIFVIDYIYTKFINIKVNLNEMKVVVQVSDQPIYTPSSYFINKGIKYSIQSYPVKFPICHPIHRVVGNLIVWITINKLDNTPSVNMEEERVSRLTVLNKLITTDWWPT